MEISNWFQNYFGWTILAFVAALFLTGFLRRRSTWFHYRTDWLMLHIPVLNNIIHLSTNARISEYLGILVGAGVGVVRTLEIITDSIENLVYKGRLILVQDAVKNGNPLSELHAPGRSLPCTRSRCAWFPWASRPGASRNRPATWPKSTARSSTAWSRCSARPWSP
jgi:hypothetical protein